MTRALDICIVTADIVGPIRNGGIGTAYYNLAHALAGAGHRVTVLYANGSFCENGTIGHWVRNYKRAGITLVPLPPTKVEGHSSLRMAHGVYEWLKTRHFDIVHCHEWRGIAFYAALGKRQGLCLQNSVLCIGAHSPVLWCLEGMNELADAEGLEVDFMERQSVARADVLWTPSQHMLEWLKRQDWTLPDRVLHLPYILLGLDPSQGKPARPGAQLVFFGRLETRKGLDLFCDALERMVKAGTVPARVTFLGKQSTVNGMPSVEYIRQRSHGWSFPWKIISSMGRDDAMEYLRAPNRVAVLPSKLDNLPYTVLECQASGIPFVASAIGGIPEMIPKRDRARVLFELTVESLANRLTQVVKTGQAPAPLAVSPETTLQNWLDWHRDIAPAPAPSGRRPKAGTVARKRTATGPLVSVCITTRNRPTFVAAALDSIRVQDYKNLEVVLVDDGSDQADAWTYLASLESEFQRRRWQIVRQPNRYVGAARNAAIAAAHGDYLLFMDDDNLASPKEVSTFVRAAEHSGADILTCFMHLFRSGKPEPTRAADGIWPFLGGALTQGLLRNVFGDANGFFRRSVFERIGGFTEDVGIAGEDWEMYARAVLRGLRVEVVPEPLVWYRQSSQGMLNTTSQHANHMRALRPYFEMLPSHLRPLVHMSRPNGRHSAPSAPTATRLDHVQRAVVFGTGEAGKLALGLADKCGWSVPWLVDNNPAVWNKKMHGKSVREPDSIQKEPVDLVIVASFAGKPAISKQLEKMGLSSGEHFVHFLDPVRVGSIITQIQL